MMHAALLFTERLDFLGHISIARMPELSQCIALKWLCNSTGVRTIKLRGAQVGVAHSLEVAADHVLQLIQALRAHD